MNTHDHPSILSDLAELGMEEGTVGVELDKEGVYSDVLRMALLSLSAGASGAVLLRPHHSTSPAVLVLSLSPVGFLRVLALGSSTLQSIRPSALRGEVEQRLTQPLAQPHPPLRLVG